METGGQDDLLRATISSIDLEENDRRPHKLVNEDSSSTSSVPKSFKSPGIQARDITQEFDRAASALKTGELVKDASFSLFDAVGALEIMDPKMDSGFLAPGETLEDDYDVSQDLSANQVLGIMDALLCAEIAWHKGHPLSQTLFTSIYIDHLLWPEPMALEDATFHRNSPHTQSSFLVHVILRAYCLALIKTCDFVYQSICAESFFEEEDFVSNLYNRSLLSTFSAEGICTLLDHATQQIDVELNEMDANLRIGLKTRLEFRIFLLRAVMSEPRKNIPDSEAYWTKCLDSLSTIESSHDLAVPVESSFSVKIQRRLASTVPPRPIIQLEFTPCVAFLRQLCIQAIDVVGVRACGKISGTIVRSISPPSIKLTSENFIQIFCSQKPQPPVYIRCILQAMIFDRRKSPFSQQCREFFFRDLEEIVLPAHILTDRNNANVELPQDPRFKIWRRMSELLGRISEPFFDIIRALCMNRARARRMLGNLIFEWDEIQLDLEEFDKEAREYTGEQPYFEDVWEFPVSSWSYFYKLRQMQWIVQLGFELQLYHTDEWPGMYWYLQELAEHRRNHVERIHTFVHRRATETKGFSKEQMAAIEHTQAYLAHAIEETIAIQALAEAFAYLYQALSMLALLPDPPPRPYGTTELRHALRLRPFLPLVIPVYESPSEPFVSIGEVATFLTAKSEHKTLPAKHQKALALLDASDVAGRRARKSWDVMSKTDAAAVGCLGCETAWRAGVREVLRSAVMAGIAGARVRKWLLAGGKERLHVQVPTGTRDEELLGDLSAAWVVPEITS